MLFGNKKKEVKKRKIKRCWVMDGMVVEMVWCVVEMERVVSLAVLYRNRVVVFGFWLWVAWGRIDLCLELCLVC